MRPASERHCMQKKRAATTDRGKERTAAILEAARDILTAAGFAGLSMRAVALRVGISLGNLQHYYASKEALIEALIEYMMDSYQAAISTVLQEHRRSDPIARFKRVVGMLWERVQDPRNANIFLEVWALSSRGGFAADIVRKVRVRQHKAMLQLLREVPEVAHRPDLKVRASMIVLLIEGLLVQLAASEPAARAELADAAMRAVMRLATEATP
jgi:AcrR family transcriptional regulator